MTGFVLLAAALAAVAFAIVVGALRRRRAAAAPDAGQANLDALKRQLRQLDDDLAAGTLDADAHARTRDELARRLLDETGADDAPAARGGAARATVLLVALAVPVLAAGLYAMLGNPAALAPDATAARAAPTQEEVEAMVAKLAERLEKAPPGRIEDLEGWVMLGRSYAVMQRYPEASRAFARALQLAPDDAQLLVDQADVLAMLQGQDLQGEPLRLIERALRLDPANPKALALAGSAAFERKDYAAAIAFWEKAQPAAPPGSEFASSLERGIAEARSLGAAGSAPAQVAPRAAAAATAVTAATAAPPAASAPPAGGAAASLRGRVSVAPALAARLGPDDTVFVFVRAAEGPRVPLAVVKRRAAELPFDFTLDDTQAMTPELRLSAFPQVVLAARVSKSGDALPASGDLEGELGPLDHRSRDVTLVLDRVRP
jgi:cytochrome c-type biogenesis protein CcmH